MTALDQPYTLRDGNAAVATDGTRLSRWFIALAVASWVQIAFGALVRAKKAGLACPDWPLCYGDVVPNLKLDGVIYEYGHRVFALVVSAIFGYAAWQVWRTPALKQRLGKWMLGIAGILLTQIVFGGLTVLIVHKGDGDPRPAAWTVSTHLILGNTFAALALMSAQELARPMTRTLSAAPAATRKVLAFWSLSILTQFVLGGIVAGNLAGTHCYEFPTCQGGVWFPTFEGLIGVNIFHRLNAYLLLILAATLAWICRHHNGLRGPTRLLTGLVLAQATLGVLNILLHLPAAVTTAHSLFAALLFSFTALLWHRVLARPATA